MPTDLEWVYCKPNKAKLTAGACEAMRKRKQPTGSFYRGGSEGRVYNECYGCKGGKPIMSDKDKPDLGKTADTPTQLCSRCLTKPVQKNTKSRKWEMGGDSGRGLCYPCYDEVLRYEKDSKPRLVSAPKAEPVATPAQERVTDSALVTLKTISSYDFGDPQGALTKATGFVETLDKLGICVDVEVRIKILPDERVL